MRSQIFGGEEWPVWQHGRPRHVMFWESDMTRDPHEGNMWVNWSECLGEYVAQLDLWKRGRQGSEVRRGSLWKRGIYSGGRERSWVSVERQARIPICFAVYTNVYRGDVVDLFYFQFNYFDMFLVFPETSLLWPIFPPTFISKSATFPPPSYANSYLEKFRAPLSGKNFELLYRPL